MYQRMARKDDRLPPIEIGRASSIEKYKRLHGINYGQE